MSDLERKVSDLQRAVTAGLDHFAAREDTQGAAGYVAGIVLPLLKQAFHDLSERVLDSHRVDQSAKTFIHYTTSRAVVSILQGKLLGHPGASLRLYDSEHSNDPEEGKYFARALELPVHLNWAAKSAPSHAYVTSFVIPSEKRDLRDHLPFWQTYGDDGRGGALSVVVPSTNLRKVLYGASATKQIRADIISILEVVSPIVELAGDTTASKNALWEALASIRYLYKDAPYDHEQECRIVVPKEDAQEDYIHFDYQARTGHLRRYYEQPYLDPVELFASGSSITVGPAAPHSEDLRYSLDLMRRRLQLGGLEIMTSEITYRSTQ